MTNFESGIRDDFMSETNEVECNYQKINAKS